MFNLFGLLPFLMADGDGGGESGGSEGGDTGFVGSDGTFKEGWANRDEFKDNAEYLGRYKTVIDLANGLVATKKKYNKNPDVMVEIPSETSGDDVRAAWGKAHGAPENVDGYEYSYSDEFATKLGPLNDERLAGIKELAKSKHWSSKDLQDVVDFYNTAMLADLDSGNAQMDEMNNQSHDEGMAILKNLWLDGTDVRTKDALEHLQKYGEIEVKGKDGNMINPLEKLLEEAPQLKQSPWLTLIMDNMAAKMGEANRHGGGDTGALSLDGVNSQIDAINDRQTAIRDESPVNFKNNAEFKRNDEKLNQLYQKKFPPK